jgi:parallel beta-helix repeat protein
LNIPSSARATVLSLAIATIVGCGNDQPGATASPASTAETPSPAQLTEDALQAKLIEAKPGDLIELPAGKVELTRSLTLQVDGVTVRGAGMDKTILSFKGQTAGAEGLLVTANDFTIEDVAIEDTKGDALKVNEGHDIVIRRVRTEWTNGPATTNGAYGIYPVQTTNTLIEESVAIGASDAGIYVGQSKNVVVRNNRAEYNVAGIEIENTVLADVYGNTATNNTGGILVFNMPDLPVSGYATRVFGNKILANNTKNFGTPGSAVAGVPAGTGVIINSNDQVEIFDNDIADNQTGNILISSFFSSTLKGEREMAAAFDPYPESIFVYGNRFSGGGDHPDRPALEALRGAMFGATGRLPDIIWDGIVNPEKLVNGAVDPALAICVDNGDAVLVNVDAKNEYKAPTVDMAAHRCQLAKLPPVTLESAAEVATL